MHIPDARRFNSETDQSQASILTFETDQSWTMELKHLIYFVIQSEFDEYFNRTRKTWKNE